MAYHYWKSQRFSALATSRERLKAGLCRPSTVVLTLSTEMLNLWCSVMNQQRHVTRYNTLKYSRMLMAGVAPLAVQSKMEREGVPWGTISKLLHMETPQS